MIFSLYLVRSICVNSLYYYGFNGFVFILSPSWLTSYCKQWKAITSLITIPRHTCIQYDIVFKSYAFCVFPYEKHFHTVFTSNPMRDPLPNAGREKKVVAFWEANRFLWVHYWLPMQPEAFINIVRKTKLSQVAGDQLEWDVGFKFLFLLNLVLRYCTRSINILMSINWIRILMKPEAKLCLMILLLSLRGERKIYA